MRIAIIFCLCFAGLKAQDVPTVPELDLAKYIGRYYQMYANEIVYEWFEKDGVCITATYDVVNATVVSVFNNMRLFTPDGPNDDKRGLAYATEEQGQFWVELEDVPIAAPYWVVKLGPVKEYNGIEQYSYAVVTDPFLFTLFVLARDVNEFEQQYETEVVQWLTEFGFDESNPPVKTDHYDNCIYPWTN